MWIKWLLNIRQTAKFAGGGKVNPIWWKSLYENGIGAKNLPVGRLHSINIT
jgi:hypothetical protein